MLLSCAMIVRDAATTLDIALQSVSPWVDELVVVDTGSTDHTCDIARRYTTKVFRRKWQDHFGKARQQAQDLCHGKWTMFLDADDELINGAEMRRIVDGAPSSTDAFLMRYVTDWDAQGNPRMEFWRERVTRRGMFHWEGRCHEVLLPNGKCDYERMIGAHVEHRGHGDGTASVQRNVRLLRMAHADDPNDPRVLFYLGRDLLMLREIDEGMQLLERYLKVSPWIDEAHAAVLMMGEVLRAQGKFADAYRNDVRMLNYQPLWPQTYYAIAEDCYYLKAWAECLHFSKIGESLPIPNSNLFMNEYAIKTAWMIYRVVALHQLGLIDQAAELTARAAKLMPDDPLHSANLRFYQSALDHRAVDMQEALAAG